MDIFSWIINSLLWFCRYLSQKKYADLLNLLYKGSTLLLQRDQQESGADLAILLVDVLNKSATVPCHEWIDKIARLFELMSASIPEREAFLTNGVKWSMDSNKKGHPFLHQVNSLLTMILFFCIFTEWLKVAFVEKAGLKNLLYPHLCVVCKHYRHFLLESNSYCYRCCLYSICVYL